MKLLAVFLAGGLLAGGYFVFGVWQDPREAGPAPVPARYLGQAESECIEGLGRAREGAEAAAFCGCVVQEVGRQFSFRDFRAAHVELEKACARSDAAALPDLLRAHATLGPIIRTCDAEMKVHRSQGSAR